METGPSRRDLRALPHDDRQILRMLILDPWFRVALGAVFLGFIGVALALPKIWRVSPPGFRPQVRVSLLNLAQAWQLRRSARQLEFDGAMEEAAAAWRAAATKNLADVSTIREALRAALSLPDTPPAALARVSTLPAWLLALGGTNASDVGLVARFFDRTGHPDEVFHLLDPLRDQLAKDEEVLYLKALLEREDGPAYAARWPRVSAELGTDATLALYHAAYLAGWGPLAVQEDARRRLAQAAEEPADQALATRLQLLDYAQARDPQGYAASLERLVEWRRDRLRDHLRYWELLAEAGRIEQAQTLARQFTFQPRNAGELIGLAEALYGLGLREQAHSVLRQHTRQGESALSGAHAIWLERAALLEANRDWRGLLDLAEELRALPRGLAEMGGWTDFLEGQAHHALEHSDQAKTAMTTAARKTFPSPQVAFEVALGMKQLGYAEQAWAVLGPLEPVWQKEPFYWQVVFQLAEAMKQDSVLLLKAAREARRLHPGDARWDFSYAAALLVNRLNAAEAVALTRDLLARAPNSPQAKVNHGHALALNQRWDEAAELIASVDPQGFDDFGRTVFHFCALEVHLARGQIELARQDAAVIQRRHLFPNQIRWLDQTLRAAGLVELAGNSGAPSNP